MIEEQQRPLQDRRLVIITGKGGCGKTTVAAALALAVSARGGRVLVVEVGRDEHIPRLIDPAAKLVGYAGRELAPRLYGVRIDPYAALAEYLSLELPVRGLVERLLRTRAFRQLMDASPGWRELITLGKVWHFEQMVDEDGRRRYDLLLVDAPSTGHGLTLLDVPRVVVSAVRAGPLHRHAEWVEAMLRDADRSLLLPVTLAEELPVRETIGLVRQAREKLGLTVDRIIVNAVTQDPFPPGVEDLAERIGGLWALPELPEPPVLAACAAHLRRRFLLNQHHLAKLSDATDLPLIRLPFLPLGLRNPADLAALGQTLLESALPRAA